MKCLRGQVFSYDLVFALMVLVFLLWYSIVASNAFADRIGYVEKENRMSEAAQSAIEQLVASPGDPSNWKGFDANSIGLAEGVGALDSRKVERFASLAGSQDGYETARAMLSMNRQGGAYLFNLRVLGAGGSGIYSVGPKEPGKASVVLVTRTAVMDGRIVHVTMKVWGIEEGVGK